jgi:hypothetical protein
VIPAGDATAGPVPWRGNFRDRAVRRSSVWGSARLGEDGDLLAALAGVTSARCARSTTATVLVVSTVVLVGGSADPFRRVGGS